MSAAPDLATPGRDRGLAARRAAMAMVLIAIMLPSLSLLPTARADEPLVLGTPLLVVGDAALDALFANASSDGLTPETAHVLSSLHIRVEGRGPAIELRDTTRHLVILGCRLEGPGGGSAGHGVLLQGCTNVSVEACRASGWDAGVMATGCDRVGIGNSTLADCHGDGLRAEDCWNVTVAGNRIERCPTGILAVRVQGLVVRSNDFSDGSTGLEARSCDGAMVDANVVSTCEHGLLVSSSDGARVVRNEVAMCTDYGVRVEAGERYVVARNSATGAVTGISIDQCHSSIVLENDATSNYVGMELLGCTGCTIRDNLVSKSGDVGLRLSGSDDNELVGNRVRLNMVGIELRSSEGNTFNGTVLRANHWRAVEGDVGDNRFTGTVESLNGWLRFVLLYLPPIVAAAVAPFPVRRYLRRRREGARPPGVAVRPRFPAGRAGLWALSAYVMDETFFISQLEQAGPQRERVIERYKAGIASAKALTTMTSLIVAAILVMLTSIPISGLMGVLDVDVTGENVNDVLFASSIPLLLYGAMLFVVLLVFTLTFLASLLQGDAFKPLGALPLDRREMRRVTAYVLLRMYGLPLAVVVLAYPVIGGVFTGSWGFFAAALLGNALNVATVLALVVWTCDVFGRRVFRGGSSRGSTALRVVVMVGYTVVAFSIFIIMGVALDTIGGLYAEQRLAGASGEVVNAALALVPFALPSSYLTAMTLVPMGSVPLPVVAAAIAGTAAQAAIAYALVGRARRALGAVAMAAEGGGGGPGQRATVGDIALRTRSPVAAFARGGLLVASREMGTLMYLIMPIVLPIMMVVPSAMDDPAIDTSSVLMGYIMYTGIGAVLIAVALSTADANLGGVLMGLPFRTRDLYRAKHATMSAVLALSLLVLLSISLPRARDPSQVLTYAVPQLALIPAVASIALLLYSAAFGRFNRRFTFFLIDPTNTVLKYISIGVVLYGLVIGEVVGTWWAVGPAGVDPAIVVGALVASNLALAAMLEGAARRMLG